MDTSFGYRSFRISHDGSVYAAEAVDGEPFQIRSINMLRVTRAIDALWNALAGKVPVPNWLYVSDLVDLDAVKETMLVIDRPGFPCFPLGPVVGDAQAAA